MDWIEREVGPVGSKVVVEVLGLEFKGQKRTSLRLKDGSRQYMEDLVVSHRTLRASDASTLACMCTLVAATTVLTACLFTFCPLFVRSLLLVRGVHRALTGTCLTMNSMTTASKPQIRRSRPP